jgi:phthiodiolone/phenolphthiodiolone dimycocerosates ketoreductase
LTAKRILFSRELTSTDVHENLRDGIQAEKQGYDFVWIPDHLVDIRPPTSILDAWTALSYVGSHTKKLMMASGVTDTQRVHPAKTANIVATLDNITDGRAVLGIGAGEVMNTKPYGIAWESSEVRIQRVREAIEVVRLLWASTYEKPVSYKGECFSLDKAHLDLLPVQKPAPPVYVGAYYSTRMLEITGELSDGWYPAYYFTVDAYRERLAIIREAARKAGRRFESIDRMVTMPVVIGDRASLTKQMKEKLKRQMITNRYLFRILGVEEALESVPKEMHYQLVSPTTAGNKMIDKIAAKLHVPDEALEKGVEEMMALGTAEQCIESVERFVKAGATHVLVNCPVDGWEEDYRAIAGKIIPHFKSR